MFNLAAIPSDSTGNSTEQDVQEQVGRQGTTNHVRGRFSNETTDQRERRLYIVTTPSFARTILGDPGARLSGARKVFRSARKFTLVV